MTIQKIRWYFVAALYEFYENEVYKTCLHYAKDEEVAKDLTQKIFFTIYEQYETLKPGRMKPYLLNLAKEITVNYLKESKRIQAGYIEDLFGEDLEVPSVEDAYIREEGVTLAQKLGNDILKKLLKKNQQWYKLIVLAYYLDVPQQKIAKQMGVSIESVHGKLYRAKQWIRESYQKEYDKYIESIKK